MITETALSLEGVWNNDSKLKRIFSWLSRIGAAPKFGSRPIGWYQQHMCKAIEILEHRVKALPVRCQYGIIEAKSESGWLHAITVRELYNLADNACRQ